MEVTTGDLWDFYDQGYHVVVPTNLMLRRDGMAVMGRGVAEQAVRRFPKLPSWYGAKLKEGVGFALFHQERLVMFPVKEDWRDQADLTLIRGSCIALRIAAKLDGWEAPYALPLVGCGFGELPEAQVLPVLKEHLQHRCFTLVRRGADVKERYPHSFAPGARQDGS
jgi:hypothetical protein